MQLQKNEKITLNFFYQKTDAGSHSYSCNHKGLTDLKNLLSNEKKSAEGHQITTQTPEQIIYKLRTHGLINTAISPAGIQVELTPDGLHLWQKYNSKVGTIAIWCTEYIWLWVILGVIIGTITLLVTIFKG